MKQIEEKYIIAGVDSKQERRKSAEEELSINTYDDLSGALSDMNPDCVIVSTSPLSHAGIIETCLKHGCNVFTEINLVEDKYDSNVKLARDMEKVLFLSSTFLYRPEIHYIEKKVKDVKGKINYIYHVGQFLPDWHPWESINDFFVGDKRTNGCREIFAIELPWIIKVFGEIESYEVISDKKSELPIQYKDNYLLLVKHTTGFNGVLCVDVISRKPVRNLEVFGESIHITWDGTPFGLKEYDCLQKVDNCINLYESVDKQDGYASFVVENAYRNELEDFIRLVNQKGEIEYSFEDDLKVLRLIDGIESRE